MGEPFKYSLGFEKVWGRTVKRVGSGRKEMGNKVYILMLRRIKNLEKALKMNQEAYDLLKGEKE